MTNTNNLNIEEQNLIVKKIYDPFLRFLHWWNALSVFSLMLTIWLKKFISPYNNGKEIIYRYHTIIGYALVVGLIARGFWGIIGPKYAKFNNMFYFKDYIELLKTRKYNNSLHWGHDRYAGLFYIIFYLLMLYQAFSGLYLAAKKYDMGLFTSFIAYSKEKTSLSILLKDIHEIIFYLTMAFTLLHVFMLIFHEIKNKYPLVQSMFSGNQYRKKDDK